MFKFWAWWCWHGSCFQKNLILILAVKKIRIPISKCFWFPKKKDSDSSDQYENLLKQKPSKKILNRSFKKELVNHVARPVAHQNKNSFLSSQIYTRENTFHTHDATHGKSTKNNSTRRKWKGNERAEWNAVEYETCLHTQPTQMSAPQQKTPEYENEITKNLLLTYL